MISRVARSSQVARYCQPSAASPRFLQFLALGRTERVTGRCGRPRRESEAPSALSTQPRRLSRADAEFSRDLGHRPARGDDERDRVALELLRIPSGTCFHLKNWRALACHLGRRKHMSDTVQAIAGLLSHQQSADLTSAQQM
jgi:hypothetical protein